MKTKPKRSNGPDVPLVRSGKATLHLLRLIGFAVALLILLALFHLLTMGIPDRITRQITARALEKGLPIQIDSIQLSPHRGWELNNVRIYSTSPDDLKPLFIAEKLYLFLWPDKWLSPSKGGWNASLYAKDCDLSLGASWERALNSDSAFRTLQRVSASVHIDKTQLQLNSSELHWGTLRLRSAGTVHFPEKPSGKTLPDIGHQAAQAANALEKVYTKTGPNISVRFDIHPGTPKKNSLEATCFAEEILWKKRVYARLSGTFSQSNGRLSLNSFQLAQSPETHLSATGSFDPETRLAQLHLRNSLPSGDLLNLFPAHAQNDLARLELRPLGPADFDVAFGPAPAEQLFEQIHADVHNLPVTRKDLTLDPLKLKLVRSGNRLELQDIQLHANGGPASGHVKIDLASRACTAAVEAQCDPSPIGTLRGGGLQKFINRFTFPAEQPSANLTFSYAGTKGSLKIDGILSGENFTCGGVPVEALQTPMAYSNRVLTLAALNATNGAKQFHGSVKINFAQKLAWFDATNSFSPREISSVLAPEKPTVLTNFTFNGPVASKGSGQVDYSGGANHAFRGTLQAEQVATRILHADTFRSDIEGRGTQLLFTNTTLECFNGSAAGSAAFDLLFLDEAAPYHMEIEAAQVDVQEMLQHISTNDHSQTRGTLSGHLDFTADAKTDFWESAKGSGQVTIEKGRLAGIPILKGFARLMPGTKLFSITTFFADYELREGKLRSENLELGGSLFSARGRGSYSPADGLNVRLRAEPLRQTREEKKWYHLHLWGADALKKGTAPLFDLLEFNLKGALKDPQWRMKAIPKEIYEVLQRDKPEEPAQP